MTKRILLISLLILGLAQFSSAQVAAKKKLATQIAGNVTALFPVQYFEDTLNSKANEEIVTIEKRFVEMLNAKLDESKNTADEKAVLKTRIAEFGGRFSKLVKDVMLKDFSLRSQTTKSIEKNCVQIFTVAELQKLDKFLKTADGKTFVSNFNQSITATLNGNEAGLSSDEEKNVERVAIALGGKLLRKFTDSLISKVMDDTTKFVEKWSDQMLKNLDVQLDRGILKQEFDKFIAENFK